MKEQAFKLVETMAAMQQEGTLCDVTLQAEQKTLPAHKTILAGGSPYFLATFNGSFSEADSKVVTFEEVTFSGLKAVVDDIYCKKAEIPMENIHGILSAAHLFQMENLLSSICDSMVDNLSCDNCFYFLECAQKYELKRVIDAVHRFIVDNFLRVVFNEKLYETPKEDFCHYLSQDSLPTEFQEIEVYKAAKKWFTVNKVGNSETVTEVMSNVRFTLIKPDGLSEIMYDGVLFDNNACRDMVRNAMNYQSNINTQPLCHGKLSKPRGNIGLVIVPCNTSNTDDEHKIHLLKFDRLSEFKTMSVCTFPKDSWMSAVNVNNFLFIFGVERNNFQHFTKRYDAATDAWLDLMPIQRQPTFNWVTAHDGQSIFLLGGSARDAVTNQEKMVNDTYKFSISTNTWMKCENLPRKYDKPSVTHLNGYIYCCGGLKETEYPSRRLFAFDIKRGKWLIKESMQSARNNHVLEAVGDKLFAIGGIFMSDNSDAIESYDPSENQWTYVNSSLSGTECYDASSVVWEDKIYLFGGLLDLLNLVFDPKTKEVTKERNTIPDGALPSKYCCALMSIPKLL